MTSPSPFDRVANQADYEAHLPVDNWLQRRADSIEFHAQALTSLGDALKKMGTVVLDGRISTDLVNNTKVNTEAVSPSEEIARNDVGILPTGVLRSWTTPERIFTPDAALGITAMFEDKYEYPGKGQSPRPLGELTLSIYAKSWGKLTQKEQKALAEVSGTSFDYGDRGYARQGSLAIIQRELGQKIDQDEIEAVLAPFAGHVLGYFDIMRLKNPGDKQPSGNFSDRNRNKSNDVVLTVGTASSRKQIFSLPTTSAQSPEPK